MSRNNYAAERSSYFGGLHVLQHFFGAVSRDEEGHRAGVASGDVESDAQVFGG